MLTLPKKHRKTFQGVEFQHIGEALDRANAAWSALMEVLELYLKINMTFIKSLETLQGHLFMSFLENVGEKYIKFHLNNLMCRALREPELMVEEMPPFFVGSLWVAVRHQLLGARSGKSKPLSFFYSLLQSKRKWLRLSEAHEEEAIKDHKIALCGVEASPLDEEMRRAIIVAVDLVVPRRYKPGKCLPTFSSCLERSVANGGNHAEESIGDCLVQDFHSGLKCAAEMISKEQYISSRTRALDSRVVHKVQLQVIPEPGKFRVITKGPSSLYTACRPLQQFLLEYWKRTPFSTMRPDWEDLFKQRVVNSFTHFKSNSDLAWVSGDYKSATDLLKWEASKLVMDEILGRFKLSPSFGKRDEELIRKAWTKAQIDYGDEELTQVNGQLMGHPLSFPVLCIINLATAIASLVDEETIARYVHRASKRGAFKNLKAIRMRLIEHGVTVNGDDIAFWSDFDEYRLWQDSAKDCGLKKSIGKNYRSRTAVMLNSRLLTIAEKPRYVGYANVALAAGFRLKTEPRMTIGCLSAVDGRLRKDVPLEIGRRLRSKFFNTHRQLLNNELNWFIDKSIGGLGLENLSNKKIYISNKQRMIAHFMDTHPHEQVLREKLDELPYGARRALKSVKRVLPPLVKCDEEGPQLYYESESHVEEVFAHFLGIYSYLKGQGNPGDYSSRIRNVVGPRMSVRRMVEYKERRYKLAISCDPHPGPLVSEYDLRTSFGHAKTEPTDTIDDEIDGFRKEGHDPVDDQILKFGILESDFEPLLREPYEREAVENVLNDERERELAVAAYASVVEGELTF